MLPGMQMKGTARGLGARARAYTHAWQEHMPVYRARVAGLAESAPALNSGAPTGGWSLSPVAVAPHSAAASAAAAAAAAASALRFSASFSACDSSRPFASTSLRSLYLWAGVCAGGGSWALRWQGKGVQARGGAARPGVGAAPIASAVNACVHGSHDGPATCACKLPPAPRPHKATLLDSPRC